MVCHCPPAEELERTGTAVLLAVPARLTRDDWSLDPFSRNASATEPARFLVHMLKVADAAATVPVE